VVVILAVVMVVIVIVVMFAVVMAVVAVAPVMVVIRVFVVAAPAIVLVAPRARWWRGVGRPCVRGEHAQQGKNEGVHRRSSTPKVRPSDRGARVGPRT
jgi:hypothetical protein